MLEATLDADPYVAQHPWGRTFWQAAAANRFLLPRCTVCGRARWYPRPFCPFCAEPDVQWVEASGRGRIYAFSALHKAAIPNIVAYVELEEGPVMMTNLVDCTMGTIAIGQAVVVRFRAAPEGRCVPVFTPVGGAEAPSSELVT